MRLTDRLTRLRALRADEPRPSWTIWTSFAR